MKIRIPLTDRVLLDFYNLLEEVASGFGQVIPGPLIKPPSFNYRLYLKDYAKLSGIFNRKYRKQKIYQFIHYLRRYGYLKTKNFEKYKVFVLTPKGIEKVLRVKFTSSPKTKSDKWLMVIFDVPEDKRKQRDQFRRMLKLLGYQQLQKSIWISPYNVISETKNLIKLFDLERFVQLLTLEKIKF
jgi:hypothetical protein